MDALPLRAMTHRSEPLTPPARTAGTSPAERMLDLPEPDGPTSATRRAPPASVSSNRPTSASLPKKSAASSSPNARSPLYGLRGGAAAAVGSGRAAFG